MSQRVEIVDAVRTPLCRSLSGSLADLSPVELLAQTVKALVARSGIAPVDVDELVISGPDPIGDHGRGLGRAAALSAGLPQHVQTTSAHDSGERALRAAALAVQSHSDYVAIVAGVDSGNPQPCALELGAAEVNSTARPSSQTQTVAADLLSAELLAKKYGLSRKQLDAYAVRSHRRAVDVAGVGEFDSEIVPIRISRARPQGATVIAHDETIDPRVDFEHLGSLHPVLENNGTARGADQTWSITQGNSAQPADGAAAMLLMNFATARRLGLRPRAQLHSIAIPARIVSSDLSSPAAVAEQILTAAGTKLEQIDHFEVDETFASIPLAWLSEIPVHPDLFNPRGGAIALGKTSCCGAIRMLTTMLNALEATGGRFGLQTAGTDANIAHAALVERF